MADLQAASTQATRAWETQLNTDFPNFFQNWGMGSLATLQSGTGATRNQLQSLPGETNFAVTEDSRSKGWEIELDASPIKGLRLAFNATRTDAIITQVGDPALTKFMKDTAAYVAGAGGSQQWFWGQDIAPSVPNVAMAYYNAYNGYAPLGNAYAALQQAQGIAASQLAKWRYNLTANYDFDHSFLKGVSVGGGVRYTSREILGYPPIMTATANPPYAPDTSRPYYSPSETYFDLWVGYHHKVTSKINWNIQLNVANVGKGNYLIPISYQAPATANGLGQPAFYRIGPTQQITLTNRFEF